MNAQVIVLGINRSGTKLASYLIAQALELRYVCFEPFRWEGGIDTLVGGEWRDQLARRLPAKKGRKEHERLPVYCNGNEKSKWLSSILCKQGWDLVKLVQTGRCKLYHALCPDACIVGLIRAPVGQFTSLNGSTVQKDDVAEQWHRLRNQLSLDDPLPDAGKWLPTDLADCARAYVTLYKLLDESLPPGSVRVGYETMKDDQSWLEEIARHLDIEPHTPAKAPMLGVSTKQPLPEDQGKYIEDKLQSAYETFLGGVN